MDYSIEPTSLTAQTQSKIMKKTALFLFILFTGGLVYGDSTVIPLRMSPAADANIISHVTPDSANLGLATPVEDAALAAQGWYSAPYTRVISGFVHNSNLDATGRPIPGAAVFTLPFNGSAASGTCQASDSIQVLSAGEWNEIRIERQTTVYFIQESLPLLPPLPELPPANAAKTQSKPAPQPKAVAAPKKPARQAVNSPVVNRPVVQSFSGRFVLAKARFGLFEAKVPFALENERGKRIAYVDTNNLVVASSLQAWLGKDVIIYGRLEKLPKSNQWVLRAQNIRPR